MRLLKTVCRISLPRKSINKSNRPLGDFDI